MDPNITSLAQPLPTPHSPLQSKSLRVTVALGTVSLLSIVGYALIPVNSPISPLGNSSAPEVVRQSLAAPEISPLAYYLAGSEKYLKEARALSQNTKNSQTETQKRSIIALLNSSLQMANNAVSYYPTSPEGYLQRARLFEVLAVLDNTAPAKAASDRALAARFTPSSSSPTPLTPADLVRVTPLEEASLMSQAIIALPQDGPTETTTKQEANASRGQITFYAGDTDVVVHTGMVKDNKLVYYTPQGDTNGEVVSLTRKSQADQQFTLHLSAPLSHDLAVEWWILE